MNIWKHGMLKNKLCFKKYWEGGGEENFSKSASFGCKCATCYWEAFLLNCHQRELF